MAFSSFGQKPAPSIQLPGTAGTASAFGTFGTFGAAPPTAQPSASPFSSSSFGTPLASQPQPAQPFGAFGGQPTQSAASTPQFGFGAPMTTATPSPYGSAGGSLATPATSSHFSFQKPATTPTTGFSFGSKPQSSASTSFFGNAAAAHQPQPQAFAVPVPIQTPQEQARAEEMSKLVKDLETLGYCWVPDSPYCVFKHIFYTVVKSDELKARGVRRPPNVDPRLWEQALVNNPDPKRLVPVQASSFQDLNTRIVAQRNTSQNHVDKLKKLSKTLSALDSDLNGSTLVRILQCKQRQVLLLHRLLSLCSKIEILQKKGEWFSENEEEFRSRLFAIQKEMHTPPQYQARVNELMSLVRMQWKIPSSWASTSISDRDDGGDKPSDHHHQQQLQSQQQPSAQPIAFPNPPPTLPRYTITDDAVLEQVHGYLTHATEGLSVLSEMVRKDERDLKVMDKVGSMKSRGTF